LHWQPFGQPLNLFSRVQFDDAGLELAVFAFPNTMKNGVALAKVTYAISEIDRDAVLREVQIFASTSAEEASLAGAREKSVYVGILSVVCGVADVWIVEN
jgi:hypothetical protein